MLLFSLVFYSWAGVRYVFLLLGMTFICWFGALMIAGTEGQRGRKVRLVIVVTLVLLILGIFKYTGFFLENFKLIFGVPEVIPQIALPIGISFYTFQLLSYVVDVYRGDAPVQKKYWLLLLYASLFHQCIAGPIVRYRDINNDIMNRKTNPREISAGITRFAIGLAKKAILANGCATVADTLLATDTLAQTAVTGVWLGVLAYSLQIYLDFSAYSDMAIGMGLMCGFHYKENFDYPYAADSVTDFWRRWHISLGSFFRDYLLYVPLFGKRRQYASLFLVWFCTGFWHGASWNYIIWGLYFGLFIFFERMIGNKRLKKVPAPIMHIYTVLVFTIGFGIFYFNADAGGISALGTFLGNLVGANGNPFIDIGTQASFMNNIFLIVAAVVFSAPVIPWLRKKLQKTSAGENAVGISTIVSNTAIFASSVILLVNSTNNPFLYWQF